MVGINGMEMPCDCWSCDLKTETCSGITICIITGKALYPMGSCFDRDKECPLVEIHEEKIIPDRLDFLKRLSKEELNAGYMKFNIPKEGNLDNTSAEGVWCWVKPDDKTKYEDDNLFGKIKAIFCNNPLNFFEKSKWM